MRIKGSNVSGQCLQIELRFKNSFQYFYCRIVTLIKIYPR